jgi:hypothetical protein
VYKSFRNLDFYAGLDFSEQLEPNELVGADAVTTHIGQAFLRYKRPDLSNLTFNKTYGDQLIYARGPFSAIYNLISGSEQNDTSAQTNLNKDGNKMTMHELILTHNTTENLTLVLDALVGTKKGFDSTTGADSAWTAIVGYADVKLYYNFFVNFRYENFKDLTPGKSASTLFYNAPSNFGNPVGAPTFDAYTVTGR